MATTDLGNFAKSIEKILDDYTKDMSEAVESGLDQSQDYLIQELQAASPSKTGDYKSHWKPGTSGKGYRRVVNDKKVPWNGKMQALAGILEYSTKHAKPHIEATRRKARPKIMKILKDSFKKET